MMVPMDGSNFFASEVFRAAAPLPHPPAAAPAAVEGSDKPVRNARR